MVSKIIAAVCDNLREEFGADGYDICTETPNSKDAPKDVKPCFFVTCKNPKNGVVKDRYFVNRQLLGNRYIRSMGLCIEYRPAITRVSPYSGKERKEPREECCSVMERLFLVLEYIQLDGSVVRGNSMQGEIGGDNVLNFFVDYDVFIYVKEEKKELMDRFSLRLNEL